MKKEFDEDYLECKAEFLRALGGTMRLKLLDIIGTKKVCVGEIMKQLNVPQPNISQHLTILKNAGILLKKREGRAVCYKITNPKILDLLKSVDDLLKK